MEEFLMKPAGSGKNKGTGWRGGWLFITEMINVRVRKKWRLLVFKGC